MIDTEAIREWEATTHTSGFSGHIPSVRACRYVLGLCDEVDAQAEENKRLEIEVANWKYWRGTATKANDKCEAENKRLREVLREMAKQLLITEMDEEDRDNDYECAYKIFIKKARAALKPDTEEGE